jgi:hypothetical protein
MMMRKLINKLPQPKIKSRELTKKRGFLSNNKPLKVLKLVLLLSLNLFLKRERKMPKRLETIGTHLHLVPRNLDKATILIEEVEPEECKDLLI